ncbi:MAG: MBG domain-containing protein, partial [Kiritimatiellia bacterium]
MKLLHSMGLCVGLAALSAAAAPEYFPRDLGTLGGTKSAATGVNDLSQVVGWSLDAAGRTQAFVWAGGTLTGLPNFPGGSNGIATAINTTGEITGYADVSGTNHHAFLYVSNSLVDLGTFGGPLSAGYAINDSREVTGFAYPVWEEFTNGLWLATFWWRTNTLLRIPPFRGFKNSCEGYGINDSGYICGTTYLYSTYGHNWAYIWKDTNANSVADEGEMTPLGSLGIYGEYGDHSEAKAINSQGQIVGFTGVSNNWTPRHAFLITPSNGTWKLPNDTYENGYQDPTNLLMRDLGTLDRPTDNSFANAINDRSWIVGTSSTSSGTNQAFLWRGGGMTNLNHLIASGTGWVLTNATGINEYNEIVGSGLYNGQPRAFILQAASALSVLGTNGAPIADSEPPSLVKGSDFGPVVLELTATNVFAIRNLGSSNLLISAWTTNGTDAAHFQIAGIPAVVAVGGVSNFTVAFTSPGEGSFSASLSFESDAAVPVTNVLFAATGVRHPQTIDFPPIADQWATNAVGLSAVGSSGLPVDFAVAFGPGVLDSTNLTFSDSGAVGIVATQAGDAYWAPAPPVTNVFNVSKVPAAIALHDLAQTYDGTARVATATTDPAGLTVEITYDGLAWAPTNAGTYAVTGTIVEALWEGWTNDVLVVVPADQTIDFPALGDQWITNAVGLAASATSGFAVEFAVDSGPAQIADFTNLTFIGTGQVVLVATQAGDANWNPAPPVTNV